MEDIVFPGFRKPTKGYFSLPNEWTDMTAKIDSLAELKIIEYIARHTWGFNEYDQFKRITVDEFMSGRMRKDETRMDLGTGLSERAVRYGINKALEHGYILCEIDYSDLARIKKGYKLRLLEVQTLHPDNKTRVQEVRPEVQTLHLNPVNSAPRSGTPTVENDRKIDTSYAPTINQSKSKTVKEPPYFLRAGIEKLCTRYADPHTEEHIQSAFMWYVHALTSMEKKEVRAIFDAAIAAGTSQGMIYFYQKLDLALEE